MLSIAWQSSSPFRQIRGLPYDIWWQLKSPPTDTAWALISLMKPKSRVQVADPIMFAAAGTLWMETIRSSPILDLMVIAWVKRLFSIFKMMLISDKTIPFLKAMANPPPLLQVLSALMTLKLSILKKISFLRNVLHSIKISKSLEMLWSSFYLLRTPREFHCEILRPLFLAIAIWY